MITIDIVPDMCVRRGAFMTPGTDVGEVLALERELQTVECRRSSARVLALLAEDFVEIGASGSVWNVASTVESLRNEPIVEGIEVHNLTGRIIDDGYVLTQWDSVRGRRRARRTSLWRRTPIGWQLVHHQGTPLP